MVTNSHGPIRVLIVHHEQHIGQMWRDAIDYASNMQCVGVQSTLTLATQTAQQSPFDVLLVEAVDTRQSLREISLFREAFVTTPVVVYLYDRKFKDAVEAAGVEHIICMPALLDEFPNVIRQAYHNRYIEGNF